MSMNGLLGDVWGTGDDPLPREPARFKLWVYEVKSKAKSVLCD